MATLLKITDQNGHGGHFGFHPSTNDSILSINISKCDIKSLKSLFEAHRASLRCVHCGQVGGLTNDGVTNNTMRVKCASTKCKAECKKGKTFNIIRALKELQEDLLGTSAKLAPVPVPVPVSAPVPVSSALKRSRELAAEEDMASATNNNDTTDMITTTDEEYLDNLADEHEPEAGAVAKPYSYTNTLLATIKEQGRTIEQYGLTIRRLEEAVAELQKGKGPNEACVCQKTHEATNSANAHPDNANPSPNPNSYAAKARKAATAPEPMGEEINGNARVKRLTEAEMSAVRSGRPLSKSMAVAITTLFFSGIKRTRITVVKSFLFTIGASPRKILNIGFVGRSVTELHIYEDYKDEIIGILKNAGCDVLDNFDPLSPENFRLPVRTCLAFEQKEQKAISMYQRRITYQLERLPEHMYRMRNYLESKLLNLRNEHASKEKQADAENEPNPYPRQGPRRETPVTLPQASRRQDSETRGPTELNQEEIHLEDDSNVPMDIDPTDGNALADSDNKGEPSNDV
jgi:hypothetical protein